MTDKPTARPSILAVLLDFDRWSMARPWSYTSSYALLDGFKANGCTTVVLPSLSSGMTPAGMQRSNSWVDARERIVGGRTFDQAWVWITHSYYSPDFWEWLTSVAPVRVAVLMESLVYSPAEIAAASPHLAFRRQAVLSDLRHMTHVLSYDELDVADIARQTGLPSRLNEAMLPPELVSDLNAPDGPNAVFLGSLYPLRQEFLAAARLDVPLAILAPPEDRTDLPQRFDTLQQTARRELDRTGGSAELAAALVDGLYGIRRTALSLVYGAYRSGFANVNLPALFKGFNGRVLETMAAATPLVTPRLDNRPLAQAAFRHEQDLLYYDPSEPGDLARQLRRLAADRELRRHVVQNARRTALERMSATRQIAGLLQWIDATSLQLPASGTVGGGSRHAAKRACALHAAADGSANVRVLEIGAWTTAECSDFARALAYCTALRGSIFCADFNSAVLPALPPESYDLVTFAQPPTLDSAHATLTAAVRLVRVGGIICSDGLIAQVGDFHLESAIARRDETIALKGCPSGFRPGVALAVFAVFGRRIGTHDGWWAVQKTHTTFIDVPASNISPSGDGRRLDAGQGRALLNIAQR